MLGFPKRRRNKVRGPGNSPPRNSMEMNAMKKKTVTCVVSAVILTSIMIPGCEHQSDQDNHGDTVREELMRIRNSPAVKPDGSERRVEKALSLWQNRTTDEQPVLIGAGLSTSRESGEIRLGLTFLDEGMDVLGVGVQEEYAPENGLEISLVEEYPALIHRPQDGALSFRLIAVRIRDAGQRKDSEQWLEYCRGQTIEVSKTKSPNYYRETLPPIWVSLPDPNRRNVCVFVYDRAGNKSDSISLTSSLGE